MREYKPTGPHEETQQDLQLIRRLQKRLGRSPTLKEVMLDLGCSRHHARYVMRHYGLPYLPRAELNKPETTKKPKKPAIPPRPEWQAVKREVKTRKPPTSVMPEMKSYNDRAFLACCKCKTVEFVCLGEFPRSIDKDGQKLYLCRRCADPKMGFRF